MFYQLLRKVLRKFAHSVPMYSGYWGRKNNNPIGYRANWAEVWLRELDRKGK